MTTENHDPSEIVIEHNVPDIATVNLQLLRRNDVSYRAKGFIAVLMSHSSGYKISMRNLVHQSSDGRDATYAALKEAKRLGYVDVRRVRDNKGRFTRVVWTVHWHPVVADRALQSRSQSAPCNGAALQGQGDRAHILKSRSTVVPERIQQAVEVKEVLQGGTPLEWDSSIPVAAREALEPLLQQLPGPQAQQVADEVAGRLQTHAVRGSVTRYARSIVQRALAGQFVPSAGVGIAELRARRVQEAAAARERQQSTQEHRRRVAKQRADPETQRRVSEMIESLKVTM
ncbi:hypothetical protein [Lysobacter sp. F60174L2]|uniref:hypothetical protein n=1 Tax=Lysobacter sp. F60174L2 TaxID=3459295 RepID=UPI00403E256A